MSVWGQFQVNAPSNGAQHLPTDTIYIGLNGDDNNIGTYANPVKTFQKAVALLPFGTAGVNGGNAYGLIRFLPGRYTSETGFKISEAQWKKNNTYKNISVEGLGDVVLSGPPGSICQGHMLQLSGNHIFVKNLTLKNAQIHGLLITAPTDTRFADIIVEKIQTDSVGGFGMLLVNCDRIDIGYCTVNYSSQLGSDTLSTPCQWPSGLKVFGCSHISVHHSEVAFTRGEGLNFHNSQNGLAYKNRLHDNTSNFYNDNSKNLIIKENYLYNSDKGEAQFWRGCPKDTGTKRTPCGILMGNEGACTNGTIAGVVFENCRTKCQFPLDYIPNIDSIYIFNNLFQDVAVPLLIWEGSTQILGINCVRNVFFYHNTCIGTRGNTDARDGFVDLFFPSYNPLTSTYGIVNNLQVYNNIFSVDTTKYPRIISSVVNYSAFHPFPEKPDFQGNLWNFYRGKSHSTDSVSASIPGNLPLVLNANYSDFIPCETKMEWVYKQAKNSTVPDSDYLGRTRNAYTCAGAFEYAPCDPSAIVSFHKNIVLYPNPVSDYFHINASTSQLSLLDLTGRKICDIKEEAGRFLFPEYLPDGMFWVRFEQDQRIYAVRLLRIKSPAN